MKKLFLPFLFMAFTPYIYGAEIIKLDVETVEKQSIEYSPKIKQIQNAMQAQGYISESFGAYLYPALTLDAKGGWVSQIPELTMGMTKLKFGDNWSYSAGPTLQYTVFDNNRRKDKVKSEAAVYNSKMRDLEALKKQVLLDARRSYFKIQRDLEKIYFLFEYMKLTQKQLKDINSAFKSGAKSRRDVIMAEKQFIKAKISISAARAVLSQDLSELFKITGTNFSINPEYPSDYRTAPEELDGITTALIEFDSPDKTLERFFPSVNLNFDSEQAKLVSYDELVKSYEYLSAYYKSELYPKINLTAGTYFEYPNGPITESVFQTRANAAISMPLFEKSKNKKLSQAQKSAAQSVAAQKKKLTETLKSLFVFSKNRLYSLKIETDLNEKMIEDSKTAVKLTYDAYNAGAVTFLEVQNANIDLLSAQTELSNLKIEKLNCLAVMDNLGK